VTSRPSDPDPARTAARKDRLIQTRVPKRLEATLKAEAQEQRLSVSQLIRNVLEDTFDLVDGVVADVDQIVTDSVGLARNVKTRARRLASPRGRDPGRRRDRTADRSPATRDQLSHVAAWNEVVLNRPIPCARCGEVVPRGAHGFVSVNDDPAADPAWLCPPCVAAL
jgi:hypothetical protein